MLSRTARLANDVTCYSALCAVLLGLGVGRTAHAQASLEPSTPGMPAPGIPGGVSAMLEWDPDGAGPQPSKIYIGGSFDSAGNTLANNIAAWNGTDWEPLGAGMDGPVFALCVHNGALYAGGRFSLAGGSMPSQNLAKWTGTAWENASPGMTAPANYYNQVTCLASFGDSLYAGGSFDTVGGYNAHGIVRFTPSGISTLGSGLVRSTYPPFVNALCVYQGGLMIGGAFDQSGPIPAQNIARWTGTTFSSTGTGTSDWPDQFAVLGSNLIILSGAGDLIQYNGSTYTPMAPPGLAASARTSCISTILGTALHIGGSYQLTVGGPVSYLYRWTGSTWVAAAAGLDAAPDVLLNTSSYLYASNFYLARAGSAEVSGIARWNGASWSRMGPAGGLNGYVWNSTKVHATDTLWITGNFTSNAGTPLNHVAQWNGTTWAPAGMGLDKGASTLTGFGNSVVAQGYNLSSNGVPLGHLAQFNGANWVSIPSELTDPPFGSGKQLKCAVQWGNLLVVGGFFGSINGVTAHNIAAWDGTQWHALGEGLDVFGPSSLAVYQGDLIAAGEFDNAGGSPALNIARWDGAAWHAMGSGINDNPQSWANSTESMAVLENNLYVCGNFGVAGGVPCRNVAKWNGTTWSALGTGLGGDDDIAWSLTTMGGAVYASGWFRDASATTHGRIYVWDGTSWNDAGGGDMGGAVYTITEHRGEIFAGGQFGAVQGRVNTSGTRMKAMGVTTPAPGMPGPVLDFQSYNGLMYACSQYGTGADNFKVWNGSAFVPVPSQPAINGNGYQMATYTPPGQSQKLILSGAFSVAGPNAVSNITAWQWPFVGTPWSTVGGLGTPGNGGATAMLEYNGNLYASGVFGTPAGHFARWNGSTWTALSPLDNWANDFAVYNGQLIAAGNFSTAGGQAMNFVARWNGAAWSPLGTGLLANPANLFSAASTLAVYNGELYVGGVFIPPGGIASPNIARWNGSAWAGVGGGLGTPTTSTGINTSISALAVFNGKLIVGGAFDSVGPAAAPITAHGIASWNGANWSSIGTGVSGSTGPFGGTYVSALESSGCELFIGGSFTAFNGVATSSAARYSDVPVPPIVLQPQSSMFSCVGSTAAFQVTHQPVGCYGVTYQWYRNGTAMANGITPWGSFVTNATTSRVVIASAQSEDQGQYTCVITSSNGTSETSEPATLFFPCVGCDSIDFNHDDLFPDTDDITTFVSVFGGGACPTGTCGDVDFNNDGIFPDVQDIQALLSVFGGGACL